MSNQTTRITFAAFGLMLLSGVYLYLVGSQTLLFADDLCRARPEFSWLKSLELTWHSYFNWQGRFPPILLNFTIFTGDGTAMMVFDIFNSVVLIGLITLVVRHMGPEKTLGQLAFISIFLFLFWFTPTTLGEVLFWRTGASSYFWGGLATLAAIMPIFVWLSHGREWTPPTILFIAYLIVCFLGGMWAEHISAAVLVAWLGIFLLARLLKRSPNKIHKWGLAAWALGTILVIAAPGNWGRMDAVGRSTPFLDKLNRILELLPSHLDFKLLALCAIFVFIAAAFPHKHYRQQASLFILWMGLGALVALATSGAPVVVFHGRVAFFSELCFILAAMALFPIHLFSAKPSEINTDCFVVLPRWGLYAISISCAALLAWNAKDVYIIYSSIAKQEAHRVELIAQAKQQGELKIKLPALRFSERANTYGHEINYGRYFARDIQRNPARNGCYARYHGMKEVSL